MLQAHQQIWEEISRDRGFHNSSSRFRDHRARFSVIARFRYDYKLHVTFFIHRGLVVGTFQSTGYVAT